MLIYTLVVHLINERADNDRLREKEVRLMIKQKQFEVINTFTGKTKKAPKGLYLSTKHEGRGIGLRSVRGIVSDYKGILKIQHENGLFTVAILLQIPSR